MKSTIQRIFVIYACTDYRRGFTILHIHEHKFLFKSNDSILFNIFVIVIICFFYCSKCVVYQSRWRPQRIQHIYMWVLTIYGVSTILWSSLQFGWPLRNIHISNDNESFTFYVDVFFLYHGQDFYRDWLYIWETLWVSYKK